MKLGVIAISMLLCLSGCSKPCETYSGEKYTKCMNCFPQATVIICDPCRAHENVEHCRPYCERCGGNNIVRMSHQEFIDKEKRLGYH